MGVDLWITLRAFTTSDIEFVTFEIRQTRHFYFAQNTTFLLGVDSVC